MASSPKQKLYCYVDETGQDDASSVFIVVAVVNAGDQDEMRAALFQIERAAETNQLKWHKTKASRRLTYLKLALANKVGGEVFFGAGGGVMKASPSSVSPICGQAASVRSMPEEAKRKHWSRKLSLQNYLRRIN